MTTKIAPVRFILVEPRESGNVGAAARAMKNFGFGDLTLVGEPRPLDEASVWWASGAEEIVDDAKRADTLSEALCGTHLVVATTSGRGREARRARSPREIAILRQNLPVSQEMAIVFGRERGGLTTEELELCHELAVIPTVEAFPVMNLAQAVSLFCYELADRTRQSAPPREDPGMRASHDRVERLHERAREVLLQIGFLNPQNPDVTYRELRSLVTRAEPSERDVTILLGVLRQLRWALDHSFSAAENEDDGPATG